ncbi:MAG: hypothetical protein IKI64_10405 [Clostridia bacterium]|nr:hypothetical protein [Clostridia bacterium]
MGYIKLDKILKHDKTISYEYSVSDDLRKFFNFDKSFVIDYPESVESVPDAIAAVPFVCNVLPIIWLADAKLIVNELDKAFFECIQEVRKGYESMYPETSFGGTIEVSAVLDCVSPFSNGPKSALFYSGGVDSMDSLIRHLDEKPDLISIWGSDISYDNEAGWKLLRSALVEASNKYDLNIFDIRSRFREFDKEGFLSQCYSAQLQRNYWYGIKHGLALLGHAAPYAYLHGTTMIYIASSNCPQDGMVRCASDPRTDSRVKFSNCSVFHDGYECTRQDKLRNIVQYNLGETDILPLHVCWETQTGVNCCVCEKCYRTMTGLIFENADPVHYGFPDAEKEMPFMQKRLYLSKKTPPLKTWGRIHDDAVERQQTLRKSKYWHSIKWILKDDFLKPSFVWRLRKAGAKIIRKARRLTAK